jgi:dihydroorotase-like cyclic amidohydrolase
MSFICESDFVRTNCELISITSGLHNGTFTIFSSDHYPFRYDHPHGKPSGVLEDAISVEGEQTCEGEALQDLVSRKPGSFRFIPNGIPGVETRLSLLYTGGLVTGRISPQKFVELTSTNPSKLGCGRGLRFVLKAYNGKLVVWTLSKENSDNGNHLIAARPRCSIDFNVLAWIRRRLGDREY